MSEHLSEKNEALDALKSAEGLSAPERQEAHEALTESTEKQAEQVEAARNKLEQAPEPAAKVSEREHAPTHHHPTRLDKEASYWDTLRSMQRHLTPASRRFSKLIHSPAIEKTSEVVGATVARPSVTLGATITAVVVGSFLYLTARAYGFALSGSELLLSLIVGGLLGLAVEGIAKLFKQRS